MNAMYQGVILKFKGLGIFLVRVLKEPVLQVLDIWDEIFRFIYDLWWTKLFRIDIYYIESWVYEFYNSLELAKGS